MTVFAIAKILHLDEHAVALRRELRQLRPAIGVQAVHGALNATLRYVQERQVFW